MAESQMPAPVAGAPYTRGALARLALGATAREVSDFARAMVPIASQTMSGDAAGGLADAARLVALAEELLQRAVVLAREEDRASWGDVGEALEMSRQAAHERWGDAYRRWSAALDDVDAAAAITSGPGAGATPTPPGLPEGVVDPDQSAERLDAWVRRHREPTDWAGSDPDHPVSAGLRRMDPVLESLHLTACRRALLERWLVPPDAALAAIAERDAVLEEALAGWAAEHAGPKRAEEHRAAAAKARALAAELRQRNAPGTATLSSH
jgi:hypothetical protein